MQINREISFMGELHGKKHHGNLDVFSRISTSERTELMRTAGVIALEPGDIFTMRPVRPDEWKIGDEEYARQVASGHYNPILPFLDRLEPRKLMLGDLKDPVPASLYYDARSAECWGLQSHCGTLTDGHFRPQLSLARKVWSSMNDGTPLSCSGYCGGENDGIDECAFPLLVDPPIQLEPIPESKIRDLNHPTLTARVSQTTHTDDDVYREGVAAEPYPLGPRPDQGQDYHAHVRPGLVAPTPMPTPGLEQSSTPRVGGLESEASHGSSDIPKEISHPSSNASKGEGTAQSKGKAKNPHKGKTHIQSSSTDGISVSGRLRNEAQDYDRSEEFGDPNDRIDENENGNHTTEGKDNKPPNGRVGKPSRSKKSAATNLRGERLFYVTHSWINAICGLCIFFIVT
jgi:hypothetical protein